MQRSGVILPVIVAFFGIVAMVALGTIAATTGDNDNESDVETGGTPAAVSRYDDGFLAPFGTPGYRFSDPDVEIELVAGISQWEVLPGEFIEVWTYNGQYPGPEIRVTEGQKVRVTLVNNLPEATTIHWHGLDVPNAEDGVPNITQPMVQPGESWTYEFTPERVGTTAYHTHANTLNQITRGLFGAFIVEPADGPLPYDHEYTMLLHEIQGLYTINGRSFPLTMERDLLTLATGESMLVRFINMGGQHHPMHLHGHQFEILSVDGNTTRGGQFQNTVDVAPGQTVDVLVDGNNPGTWVFHCHIIPHAANRGEYPGGMIAVVDYTDHESYFDVQRQITFPETEVPEETPEPTPTPEPTEPADGGEAVELSISAFNLEFDTGTLTAPANTEIDVVFENNDPAIPHNIAFYETDSGDGPLFVGEIFSGVETRTFTFTTPDAGTYFFRCDVHPTTMVGELVVQ